MLNSREKRIEEFYAKRRNNRFKFKKCDPEAELDYIKIEKEFNKKYPPDPARERLIKSAIDYLCVQLRIRKIVPEYHRNKKEVNFFYYGYQSVRFCYYGYITISCGAESPIDRVQFMVSDGRDLIEKLKRFKVLDGKF